MGANDEQENDASAASVALEQAIRRYNAEAEVARQLASRMSGMVTLVSAVLGLGLFHLSTLANTPQPEGGWISRIMLAVSLVWAFSALVVGFVPRLKGGIQPSASDHLAWPSDPELQPDRITTAQAILMAEAMTIKAGRGLQQQNARSEADLDRMQRMLLWAALYASIAILWYLFGGPAGGR